MSIKGSTLSMNSDFPRTVAAAAEFPLYQRTARRILLGICASGLVTIFCLVIVVSILTGVSHANWPDWVGAIENAAWCMAGLAVILAGAVYCFCPSTDDPFDEWTESTYTGFVSLNRTLAATLHKGTTSRLHATVSAALLKVIAQADAFNVQGDDKISQIMTARLTTVQAILRKKLAEVEGIDGQGSTPFGQRFLDRAAQVAFDQRDQLNRLAEIRAAYDSALLFDTEAGRTAAMEMLSESFK